MPFLSRLVQMKLYDGQWAHLSAYARWAHMHCFLSVRPSVTSAEFRLENNLSLHLNSDQKLIHILEMIPARMQVPFIGFHAKLRASALTGVLYSTSSCIYIHWFAILYYCIQLKKTLTVIMCVLFQGVFTLTMNERFNVDGGYLGKIFCFFSKISR